MATTWFKQAEDYESSLGNIGSSEDETYSLDGDGIDSDIEIALYGQLHHESKTKSSTSNDLSDFLNAVPQNNVEDGVFFFSSTPVVHKTSQSLNADKSDQNSIIQAVSLESEEEPPPKKRKHDNNTPEVLHVESEIYYPICTPKQRDYVNNVHKRQWVETSSVLSVDEDSQDSSESGSSDSIVVLSDTDRDITLLNVTGNINSSVTNSESNEEVYDPTLWHIDDSDRYASLISNNRYYNKNRKFKCFICGQRGHLSKDCREPKKILSCYLCGQLGHHGDRCINPICVRCQGIGHSVEFCRVDNETLFEPCPICSVPGHLREECPDMWRRYHLTLQEGPVVKPPQDAKLNSRVYCYNCAKKGHHGYECRRPRMDSLMFPQYPFIVKYLEPSKTFPRQYGRLPPEAQRSGPDYDLMFKWKMKYIAVSNRDFQKYCNVNPRDRYTDYYSKAFRLGIIELKKRKQKKKKKDVSDKPQSQIEVLTPVLPPKRWNHIATEPPMPSWHQNQIAMMTPVLMKHWNGIASEPAVLTKRQRKRRNQKKRQSKKRMAEKQNQIKKTRFKGTVICQQTPNLSTKKEKKKKKQKKLKFHQNDEIVISS